MSGIKLPKLRAAGNRLKNHSRIGKKFKKLSRAQQIITLIFIASIFLSGSIFVIAELGGYGVNGPATAPNSLNYGLVGHWDFEEGDGQAVKDKSGSGNNGTLGSDSSVGSDDPVFSSGFDSNGPEGTGMKFDGADDYVLVPHSASLNTSAVTLSFFVKFNSFPGDQKYFIQKSNRWGVGYRNSKFFFIAWNAPIVYSTTVPSLNTWYHVVATYDGSNVSNLYINGVLENSLTGVSTQSATADFYIGYAPTLGDYLNGSMDEVRVYNRAISADETRLLYNQKKPVLDLRLDEGAGATAYDESFNDNDGAIYGSWGVASSGGSNTLTASRTWTANEWMGETIEIYSGTGSGQTRTIASNTTNQVTVSSNWDTVPDSTSRYRITSDHEWTTGKSGTAVSIDAYDDYVGVADAASLRLTKNITMEAWVYPTGKYGTTSWNRIISKDDTATGYVLGLRDGDNNGTLDSIVYRLSAAVYVPAVINYNTWYHLAVAYDGANVYVYQDGKEIYRVAYTGTVNSGTSELTIGHLFNNADYLNGTIDSVRVYNYARTADEVRADYDEGLAADLGKNNQDLNKGLIGYWDMEEGQGQVVKDKSGNNNDCTLGATSSVGNDDPTFAPGHDATGVNGTGMKFDGINDYLNCGNSGSLDTTQAITTSVWFYTDRIPASYFGLVGEQYTDSNGSYQLYLGGSNQIIWATALEPNTRIRTVGTKSFVGAWHNVTSTFSLDEQLQKIYVDGVKIIEESRTVPLELSTQSLKIGGQSLSMGTIDGYIDEVRIYNRALSDDEIRYLYNQKKPVLQLKMDEGSGNKAYDESFDNNDGTLGDGTCLPGAGTCPSWMQGQWGSALSFDGVDDYVDLENDSSLDITREITLEGWFKSDDTWNTHVLFGKNRAYYIALVYPNTLRAYLYTADYNLQYSSSVQGLYTTDEWYHVALCYEPDFGYIKLYLNGKEVEYETAQAKTDTINITTNHFMLGSNYLASAGYDGALDDVRVYNYARTDSEILADYNAGQAAHLGRNNQDLNQGLVGWWDFEEGQGQTLKDKSGNGNDCTLGSSSSPDSADPIFASGFNSSGARGTGIKFDAINDYGNLGNGSSLTSNSGFTYSFWMKRSGSDRGGYGGLVEYLNRGNQNSRILIDDTSSRIIVQDAGGTKLTSTTVFAQDTFYHVTLTWDGSLPRLYVNGSLDATGSASDFTAITANNIKIGIGADWSPTYYLNGIMDEVRIYNRALSVDETRMLYNQKKPVLNLKMDEGSGTSVKDESFNNNDGTLGDGTCQPGAGTCPSWIQGKFGAALNIDGSDDYISIPSSASVSPSKYITVEAWVKYGGYVHQWSPIVWKNNSYQMDLWTNGATPHFGVAGGEATAREVLPVGVWTHLTGTYDGSNVRLYVNGIEVASGARTGNITVNSNPVYSGAVSGLVWRYKGGIDDIRIYNYARSASEVLTDYNAGQAAHLR